MSSGPTFPWHLRALNRIERTTRAWGLGLLPFRPAALMEIAARRARLSDFAEDADLREGLEVLCRAAEEDARLTLVGRQIIRPFIVRALVNRLRTVEAQRREPEIAATRAAADLSPRLVLPGVGLVRVRARRGGPDSSRLPRARQPRVRVGPAGIALAIEAGLVQRGDRLAGWVGSAGMSFAAFSFRY